MPALRSISGGVGGAFTVTGSDGSVHTLNPILIPSTVISVVEAWLNTTWLPSIAPPGITIAAHVFSTSPLRVAYAAGPTGFTPPANWWNPPTGTP